MAKPGDSTVDSSFDLDRFRKLLQLMEKYGVTSVSLQKDGEQWKVRRGPKQVTVRPDVAVAPPVATGPAAQPAAPAVQPTAAPPAPAGITIDAPTVGTFYAAPSPDDPPFVSVGSTVKPDTIVCTIEAMKVFNQIPAEKSGTIVEILVENGDPVEFNQPLFRIEPS